MADTADRLTMLGNSYPTIAALMPRARRRLPAFAYDFLMGGTGAELGYNRNIEALAKIEIVPRYGSGATFCGPDVDFFGQKFAMPLVIAPVGMDGAIWPGATAALARAAKDAGIPYMTGTLACDTLESVAQSNPDGTWFQLYTMPKEDHRVSLDLTPSAPKAIARRASWGCNSPLTNNVWGQAARIFSSASHDESLPGAALRTNSSSSTLPAPSAQ